MRHDRGDPVAGPDAVPPERGREARDLPVQLAIAELAPDAVLAQRHDRRTVVAKTQQVLGEVEPRADEPARPRHAVAVDQHLLGRPARHHAGELPERRPELFRPIDRPGAQRWPLDELGTMPGGDLAREAREICPLDPLRCRPPERLRHARACLHRLPPPAAQGRAPPPGRAAAACEAPDKPVPSLAGPILTAWKSLPASRYNQDGASRLTRDQFRVKNCLAAHERQGAAAARRTTNLRRKTWRHAAGRSPHSTSKKLRRTAFGSRAPLPTKIVRLSQA